jgi:hypothetical protein
MKRPTKGSDGLYHIKDKKYKMLVGSRQQVWNNTAHHTSGGLVKSKLIMNTRGRIVSKDKSSSTKKENGSRFKKSGYALTRKGMKFGPNKTAKKGKGKGNKNKTRGKR